MERRCLVYFHQMDRIRCPKTDLLANSPTSLCVLSVYDFSFLIFVSFFECLLFGSSICVCFNILFSFCFCIFMFFQFIFAEFVGSECEAHSRSLSVLGSRVGL